jgi:hypothetical protein
MRRFPTTLVILAACVVAAVGGWLLFARSEHERFVAVDQVRQSRSAIRFSLSVDHERGAIAREEWRFANVDGHSTAAYSAVDRRGTRASFDEPVVGYDVTFLFDRLVADGIWELQTRPFRGADPDVHTVRIEQTTGTQSGSHSFAFSDARYLATTAGREYHIHLDRDKPVPDLLRLDSTSSADPRYQKVIDDFTGFGSPRFKRTVAEARRRLLRS